LQNQLLLVVIAVHFPRSFCISSAKLVLVLTIESLLHIGGLHYEQENILTPEEKS